MKGSTQGPNLKNPEAAFEVGDYEFQLFLLPARLSARLAISAALSPNISVEVVSSVYEMFWGWTTMRWDSRFKVLLARKPIKGGPRRFVAVFIEDTYEAACDRMEAIVQGWTAGPNYSGDDVVELTHKDVRRLILGRS